MEKKITYFNVHVNQMKITRTWIETIIAIHEGHILMVRLAVVSYNSGSKAEIESYFGGEQCTYEKCVGGRMYAKCEGSYEDIKSFVAWSNGTKMRKLALSLVEADEADWVERDNRDDYELAVEEAIEEAKFLLWCEKVDHIYREDPTPDPLDLWIEDLRAEDTLRDAIYCWSEELHKELERTKWEAVSEGQIMDGTVRKVKDFGAFVELAPGLVGLVHISQCALRRITKVEDAMQVGQDVRVKVLKVDKEAKRISLSIREALTDEYEHMIKLERATI